jgi:hypothetical protein
MRIVLAFALAFGGCAFSPSKGPPRAVTDEPAPQTPRPAAHSLRLGWVAWGTPSRIYYCNRRLDDQGNPVGVTGPCWRLEAGESEPHRMVAWMNAEHPDATTPDAFPGGKCRVELEDAQLVPAPRPARAWLVAPSGKTLLDEWTPDPKVVGDLFAVEVSFAPEGKWMALVHLAVGLGEGERSVEFAGAAIRPLPGCR